MVPVVAVSERTDVSLTIAALRREIAARLRQAFVETGREGTPDLDARLLVAHVLGCDPGDVILHDERAVGPEIEAAAVALAERRIAGEPVARIVGHKEFYGLDLKLTPATLVPRPETETLVDVALGLVERRWGRDAAVRIVDVGTGSGAILLALLSELPNAQGLGTDISLEAVATARDNARRLGLLGRAGFVVGDWLEPVAAPVGVIVANPPYIQSDAIAGLAPEVRDHDPGRALDGGGDGLEAIRVILSCLPGVLSEDGAALIEIGAGQGEAVRALAAAARLAARLEPDLAGIDRVAVVTRWP